MTTSPSHPTIAVVLRSHLFGPILAADALDRLRSFAEVLVPDSSSPLQEQAAELLARADGCVMGWGSPRLEGVLLDGSPRLRILAYAAGSVRPVVSEGVFERNIVVTSAAAANADEVAAYALGAILCGLKGVFPASRITRGGGWSAESSANDVTARTVGIVGSGHVGMCVLKLLKGLPNGINVLLYDPYVSVEDAAALGAVKVDLDELLSRSGVVSLHAPSILSTRHMINESNLRLLSDHAVFINSARGELVDPGALIAELERRPTLQAVLDVTDPDEPPSAGHPFRTLPNVVLTPHIAGAVGPAQRKMGDLAVEELYRYFVAAQPPQYPITAKMLNYMA